MWLRKIPKSRSVAYKIIAFVDCGCNLKCQIEKSINVSADLDTPTRDFGEEFQKSIERGNQKKKNNCGRTEKG